MTDKIEESEMVKEVEALWSAIFDLRRNLEEIAGNLEYLKELLESKLDDVH